MNQTTKIGFIGCGNMAIAIIRGLTLQGVAAKQIRASNPRLKKRLPLRILTDIQLTHDNTEVAKWADILLLTVKPQVMHQVNQQLKNIDLSKQLLISVAAGVSTDKITTQLAQKIAIIRAMPNTPAALSQGATGLFANQQSSEQDKKSADWIFSAVGTTEWLTDEALMDVVTAIAGSSPAYVFLFIQAMVEQASQQGLDSNSARKLATQAVLGACKLAQNAPETSLQVLREAVTSPNGTTAAAITSLEKNGFSNIIKTAVAQAVSRGQQLGDQL